MAFPYLYTQFTLSLLDKCLRTMPMHPAWLKYVAVLRSLFCANSVTYTDYNSRCYRGKAHSAHSLLHRILGLWWRPIPGFSNLEDLWFPQIHCTGHICLLNIGGINGLHIDFHRYEVYVLEQTPKHVTPLNVPGSLQERGVWVAEPPSQPNIYIAWISSVGLGWKLT